MALKFIGVQKGTSFFAWKRSEYEFRHFSF